MNFSSERPIYIQIKEKICQMVARGDLCAGGKMPSLRDLALQLKVNPNTAQRAYRELEEEGLLFTRRGQGTFVVEDDDVILSLREKLGEDRARAYLEGAQALGLSGRESIRLLERLVDGEEENLDGRNYQDRKPG